MSGEGDFAGRVVLVTGGGSGIGRAVAEAFLAAGARVAVCGRRVEPLRTLVEPYGERALALPCDVSAAGEPARAVAEVAARFGGLDVLVNNAGTFALGALEETDDETLTRIFAVNVLGLLAACRAATPHLVERRGAIVNVGSVVGQQVIGGSVAYAGSKAAVDQITRCLAAELGPRGVRVNCVAPGNTETPMAEPLLADPQARAATEARTALGRIGQPEDIAPAVLYLARDPWVTGQVLQASGGLIL